MKVRNDFVTNSSSSSFIISKRNLTEQQMLAIRYHSELGRALKLGCAECAWQIKENDFYIAGSTYLDNYCIEDLFEIIGIQDNIVEWGDDWDVSLPTSNKHTRPIYEWEKKLQYICDSSAYKIEDDEDNDKL